MYDLTAVRRRYFAVKLKNGRVLDLEPPKLKLMNQLVHIAKSGEKNGMEAVDEMAVAFARVLSKNKQNCRVTAEQVREQYDWDEMFELLAAYFRWLHQEKQDPN